MAAEATIIAGGTPVKHHVGATKSIQEHSFMGYVAWKADV